MPPDFQPAPPPAPAFIPGASQAGSGLKIFWILGGVVIVGAALGAYFFFFNNGSPVGFSNTLSMKNNFACDSLLPDGDFKRLTGRDVSEFKLMASDSNPSLGEGGVEVQTLKDQFGIQNEQFAGGSRIITCSYFLPENPYKDSSIAATGDFLFTLTTNGGDMTATFDVLSAYQDDDTISVLSTNKQFIISVFPNEIATMDSAKEAASIIDSNI